MRGSCVLPQLFCYFDRDSNVEPQETRRFVLCGAALKARGEGSGQ